MGIFAFLRDKRIGRYTEGASDYVARAYVPAPPEKEPVPHKEKRATEKSTNRADASASQDSGKADTGIVQSTVRFCLDDSFKELDQFQEGAVAQLFLQYPLNNALLNKQLEPAMNMTFVDALNRHIRMKGWKNSSVYKAAQMDRRLFSKIISDRWYQPSKDTALALAIALGLNLSQTVDLLERAGYTLSHSNKRDVIIEYFIRECVFELSDINEVLYKLDQKIIGR